MLWSFDLIGDFLVWKVGNGASVRIGMDPWVGCKWRNLLPPHLIDKLHSVGIFSLKDIGCPGVTYLREEGWISSNILRLEDNQDILCWNGYLAS